MSNPEGRIPVSSVENMRERNLSSLVFQLESLFPDRTEEIENTSNSFIQQDHQEVMEANHDLEAVGLKPLTQEELKAIELFYQLKAEKQLRDSFSSTVKRVVYRFLQDISESSDQMKQNGETRSDSKSENFFNLTRDQIEEYKFSILSTFTEEEMNEEEKQQLATYSNDGHGNKNKSISHSVSIESLVGIIKADPVLLEQFVSLFEKEVETRKGYNARQIRESVAMLSALFSDLKKGEKILDLCTGTGVISTIVKNLGCNIQGLDLNKYYLNVGKVYDKIMQKKSGEKTEEYLHYGDILESQLPNSEVWIAKHPCAPNMALPDKIIQRFAQDTTAERLYLLTCCADKSVHCCPTEYKSKGITTEKQWDGFCSAAIDVGLDVDSEKIKKIQEGFKGINETRIKYIKEILGLEAELVEVPGTVMNQMIVVRKKGVALAKAA